MKFRWETEFKETEIGEIPRDWEVKKLGEVVEVEWGNTNLTKKIYKEDGYPVFSATGQDGYADFYEREGEAVIVSAIGAYCGVCFYAKNKWTAIKNTLVLQNKKIPCDIKFLFYFLNDKEKWPELGSGQPFISKSAAEEVLIVYPPLPEQSRIATVLSWFDDLMEVKKRQNEILEKTAMAIFKSWFIDFEPFKDEEFIFNEELEREIPKGWEVKKLGDVAEILMGQSPPSKFYNEEGIGIPFIQGKGQLGKYTPESMVFCSCDGKLAKLYDILITVRAPVGELNLADKEYIIGRGITAIRSIYWAFLYVYLNFNKDLLKSFEKGTTYDAITKEDIENFLVLISPPHILQSFHSLVEPLLQKIILNQKQIMTIRKIRDTLLPLLVFGKLRVEEL
jgi:type I restriction enzyme S subunit